MPTNQLHRERAVTAGTRLPPQAPRPDPALLDLEGWTDKVKALPDLRWEKVQALRHALSAGEYDLDACLNELIDHLPGELRSRASA